MTVGSQKKLSEIEALLRGRILACDWKAGDKLPTDFDLAKSLGCSIGTVSKALGLLVHDGLVERKTKSGTRVLRNSIASRISEVDLDAFAFIYSSDRHEGISRMLHGFEHAAREKGRRLVMLPTGLDFEKEAEIIGRLEEFDVRGAVVCPAIQEPQDQVKISQLLLGSRMPLVLIGLNLPGFSAAAVLLDNFHAGYQMTRYLLKKGYKEIGFLSNYSWVQFMRDRFSGYRQAMEEAGHEIRADRIHLANAIHVNLSNPTHEPMEIAANYLAAKPAVEAVVCADDFMAIGLMKAARLAGLGIPKDLKVVGIDDFAIARESEPPLTTYRVSYETMGRRSFETLESLVGQGKAVGEEILIRGEIVVRESA